MIFVLSITFKAKMKPVILSRTKKTFPYLPFPNGLITIKLSPRFLLVPRFLLWQELLISFLLLTTAFWSISFIVEVTDGSVSVLFSPIDFYVFHTGFGLIIFSYLLGFIKSPNLLCAEGLLSYLEECPD